MENISTASTTSQQDWVRHQNSGPTVPEFEEALAAIESIEFSARLTALASYRQFQKVALADPRVRVIVSGAQLSHALQNKIVSRINRIASMRPDPRYLHPKDTALAVMLIALAVSNPNLAKVTAGTVMSIGQIWLAQKAALAILIHPKPDAENTRKQQDDVAFGTKNVQAYLQFVSKPSIITSAPIVISTSTDEVGTLGSQEWKAEK